MENKKLKLFFSLFGLFIVYTIFIYAVPVGEDAQGPEVISGKMIWQQKNCTACHQLYGLGGFLGPDLTNVYSNPVKGPEYISVIVSGGTTVMPAFSMTAGEMNSLLAFLRHVDASGQSDPKIFKVSPDGTIERK